MWLEEGEALRSVSLYHFGQLEEMRLFEQRALSLLSSMGKKLLLKKIERFGKQGQSNRNYEIRLSFLTTFLPVTNGDIFK